jgi:CrcB protein
MGSGAKLLLIAAAGAAGTLARYGLGHAVQAWVGSRFPWGTLTVNLIGCFVFGIVWALVEYRVGLDTQARLIILTGFLGAFTTFSTFGFETAQMIQARQWFAVAGNLILHNILGVAAVLVAIALVRWWVRV